MVDIPLWKLADFFLNKKITPFLLIWLQIDIHDRNEIKVLISHNREMQQPYCKIHGKLGPIWIFKFILPHYDYIFILLVST